MQCKKILMTAAAIITLGINAAAAQPGWVPPGNDPDGYYSQSDHNGYYDRNGTYRHIRGNRDDYGPPPPPPGPPPPPPSYYEQGRYEENCHRGNTAAGTVFGALAGGLIGGAASHGNGGAVAGGAILANGTAMAITAISPPCANIAGAAMSAAISQRRPGAMVRASRAKARPAASRTATGASTRQLAKALARKRQGLFSPQLPCRLRASRSDLSYITKNFAPQPVIRWSKACSRNLPS